MKKYLLILNVICMHSVLGQNLVSNSDFEIYTNCPSAIGQVYYSTGWANAATNSSVDYFNPCATYTTGVHVPDNGFGYQYAHSGVGYAGLYTLNAGFPNDAREYLRTVLNDTMVAGHKYLASMYINLCNFSKYSISTLAMYFTPSIVNNPTAFVYVANPQIKSSVQLNDTLNWMLIQDTVTAIGNELHLTIGNFSYDSLSDTIDVAGGGPSFNGSYYYVDDVSVVDVAIIGIKEAHAEKSSINIYPNPAASTDITVSLETKGKAILTDVFGKTIQVVNMQAGTNNMDVSGMENGLYFLYIENQQEKTTCTRKIFVQH